MGTRETFGTLLTAWIASTGSSQSDLARRVGTTQATISRYCDGSQFPTLPIAVRLRAVTKIPIERMTRPTRIVRIG